MINALKVGCNVADCFFSLKRLPFEICYRSIWIQIISNDFTYLDECIRSTVLNLNTI